MDRKTKHRILGVLVVIGLVIILLPFLQSEKGLPSEKTVLKAPPFPDQAVQVTTATQEPTEPPIVPTINNQSADNEINQQPDDTIRVVRPSVINAKIPEMQGAMPDANINGKSNTDDKMPADPNKPKAVELPAADEPEEDVKAQIVHNKIVEPGIPNDKLPKPLQMVKQSIDDQLGKIKPFTPQIKTFIPETTPKSQSRSSLMASLDKNGLAKLQNAAWVIQLGSFKNKANALRLVNQLRANGYSAFIQEVSTSFGDATRVFVGPESKHTAARELASQLENDLHIHGIVISYKPLAL